MNKMLSMIKSRRSIRKYEERQVPLDALEAILEAGLYAPNAGGGQRSKIVAVHNQALAEQLGRQNIAHFSRASLAGSHVSSEQPSVIDDPRIQSGFYGAPTVCIVFGPRNFLYSIPDAYCCAGHMTLAAHSLGVSSCIIARGEETFEGEFAQGLLRKWAIPDTMIARCFVLLGYCRGDYPAPKPRKDGRRLIVEG